MKHKTNIIHWQYVVNGKIQKIIRNEEIALHWESVSGSRYFPPKTQSHKCYDAILGAYSGWQSADEKAILILNQRDEKHEWHPVISKEKS